MIRSLWVGNFDFLAGVFDTLDQVGKVPVGTHQDSCVKVVLVRLGQHVDGEFDVDTLLGPRSVRAFSNSSQTELEVVNAFQSLEKALLVLVCLLAVSPVDRAVVVLCAHEFAIWPNQLDRHPTKIQIRPAVNLLKPVV